MNTIWGVILIIFTLVMGWLGQVINATSPKLAVRLGLDQPEAEVDRTFYLDGRGESIWDALILWTLPAAGPIFQMARLRLFRPEQKTNWSLRVKRWESRLQLLIKIRILHP